MEGESFLAKSHCHAASPSSLATEESVERRVGGFDMCSPDLGAMETVISYL